MTQPSILSSKELLRKLLQDPNDIPLRNELDERLQEPAFDNELSSALDEVLTDESPTTEDVQSISTDGSTVTWANCIGEQECHPLEILKPKSLVDLVSAVKRGKEQNVSARAVGSGHSFSNVCPLNKGLLLDPKKMNKVLSIEVSSLKDPLSISTLFRVESGMTIASLNEKLDKNKPSLALINMGAYDGQTLAGAISTGTHGTGITLGPIASSVKSLVIVSESGIVYQVEPANGITDPAKFIPGPANIVLKQDDDWFQSALVAMGCMGLIYSYTLEVMPAYLLSEIRGLDTWEALRLQLSNGINSPLIASNRHFEIDLNPYPVNTKTSKGQHRAITIKRNVDTGKPRGSRGYANWLSGLLAVMPGIEKSLVKWLNKDPKNCPAVINRALATLKTPHPPYVAKSFEVMNLGNVDKVKAYALELSLDATTNLVEQVDKLVQILEQAAHDHGWYLTGPVALRFVAPASAFLAPQQGRSTCMVELDMLYGTNNGCNLLKTVKEKMCVPGSGVRVHWGLDLDTVKGQEMPGMFENWSRWLSVYHELNKGGMWNSGFTDRLGISMHGK